MDQPLLEDALMPPKVQHVKKTYAPPQLIVLTETGINGHGKAVNPPEYHSSASGTTGVS